MVLGLVGPHLFASWMLFSGLDASLVCPVWYAAALKGQCSSYGISLIYMARSAVQAFSWLTSSSLGGFSCYACDVLGVTVLLCFGLGTPLSDIWDSVLGVSVSVVGVLASVSGILVVLRSL